MPKAFSVFSLNLRFGLADDGPNSWPNRTAIYPMLLKRYSCDFMCFQEANDFQIDHLQTLLPDYSFIGGRKPAPKFWQSNVIFYRNTWECNEKDHFYLSHTPDIPSRFKQSRWPRQCTIGVFNSSEHQLLCANTHFDFDSGVQEKSAALVMKRLSKWSQQIPVILVGDFNADPSDVCYETFTQETEPGIAAFKNSFSNPFPGTYHGFTGNLEGNHIDWILFRGSLARKNAQIITDNLDGHYPSDHFPLRAVFEFNE